MYDTATQSQRLHSTDGSRLLHLPPRRSPPLSSSLLPLIGCVVRLTGLYSSCPKHLASYLLYACTKAALIASALARHSEDDLSDSLLLRLLLSVAGRGGGGATGAAGAAGLPTEDKGGRHSSMVGREAEERAAAATVETERGEKTTAESEEEADTPNRGRSRAGRYDATKTNDTTLAHTTPHRKTGEDEERAEDRRDDSRTPDTPRREGGGNIGQARQSRGGGGGWVSSRARKSESMEGAWQIADEQQCIEQWAVGSVILLFEWPV